MVTDFSILTELLKNCERHCFMCITAEMDIQLRIFKNVWAYVLSSFSRLQVELELKGTSEHLAFEETKSGFS